MSHVTLPASPLTFPSHKVLSRLEAKLRLQQLTPGTEEYSRLQNVLIKASGIVEVHLSTTTYRVDTSSENGLLLGGFGSSEHVAIGEAVNLKGLPDNTLLTRGLVPIRFHHIVALAGDFYGVVGEAISLPGGTDQEKTERFKKAFNTLAEADQGEIRKVLVEIDHECTAVKHSSLPHHCYSNDMIERNKAIKKIKDDVDALLIDNSDHFFKNAEDAYRIGHTYAISEARDAGQRKDLEGLKRAYAIEAFACHFLTDLFAAGHIRNQRGPLETFLVTRLEFSRDKAKVLAGILTGAQHEKDGSEGLNVSDKEGHSWRAYGDGCFFTPKNKENRQRVIAATQKSVDEVYHAFFNPASQVPSTVDRLIPSVDTSFNPPPLYSVEEAKLFLHQGSKQIEIATKVDYLQKGLSQALRYLPQEYINGFITPNIEIPPILNKVVIPQIERLTGVIWHMVGLATYHQVKQENQELNAKIDEVADILKASYDNTEKILQQMQVFNSQLKQLAWDNLFKELGEAISAIKDRAREYKSYKGKLNDEQRQEIEKDLRRAYIRMLRIFDDGTVEGKKILVAYASMLKTTMPLMNPSEIRISVTLWFRQMLDYQVYAFSLYSTLQAPKNNPQHNQEQIFIFESDLLVQLDKNKEYIDEMLILQSQSYIDLQLKKSEKKRIEFRAP